VFGELGYQRGDVFELKTDRNTKGNEQSGRRYAVILQSNDLPLSTVVIAPTSTNRSAASFRPEIEIHGLATKVLVEQMRAIDPQSRLGRKVAHLAYADQQRIKQACAVVLDIGTL